MDRGTRMDADVAGSPSKEIQDQGDIAHSSGPCTSTYVKHVSVGKRKAADDGDKPSKRTRCGNLTSQSGHGEVSVEDRRIHQGKRKASDDAGPPGKKTRSSSSDPSVILVEGPLVESRKRKASDDGDAPGKKMWCSDNSSSVAPLIIVTSVETTESSSSDFIIYAGQDLDNALSEQERILQLSSTGNTSRADFEEKYRQLTLLGAGGFGSVYEGLRVSDFCPVAIKHIPIRRVIKEKWAYNGKVYDIILEVALMLKSAGLPGSGGQSAAVSLLDWYTLDEELILVMERPTGAMDLRTYVKTNGGSLDEQEAKMILRQLVDAAVDMHSKGVFHRDIKQQNILVQMDDGEPRVRVIDFGCGTFSTETTYREFCGTRNYFPPEWFDYQRYSACPTTVWQLGALFYSLLKGHKRFSTRDFIGNYIQVNRELSKDVQTLLYLCLDSDPEERITLEDLQHHLAQQEQNPQ